MGKYLILDLETYLTQQHQNDRRCTHLEGKQMELKPQKTHHESGGIGGPSENHGNSQLESKNKY
jgi:hypothetical protein